MSNYEDPTSVQEQVPGQSYQPPPGYQPPPMHQPPPQGYGYGFGYGYGMHPRGMLLQRLLASGSKPFFLTSEFLVSVLAALLIAITAVGSESLGAWRAWILITIIVSSYSLSRGIAKSGTSRHEPGQGRLHGVDGGG